MCQGLWVTSILLSRKHPRNVVKEIKTNHNLLSLLISVSVAVTSVFRCQAGEGNREGWNCRNYQKLAAATWLYNNEVRWSQISFTLFKKSARTAFFVKLPNERDKEPGISKVLWVSTETSYRSVPVIDQLLCLINNSNPHDLDGLGPVLAAGGTRPQVGGCVSRTT